MTVIKLDARRGSSPMGSNNLRVSARDATMVHYGFYMHDIIIMTLGLLAVSVMAAKSTTWFELFWVPLIPFSRKHMWLCSICHWSSPITPGYVVVVARFR